jgi:hypothetical protein
MKEVRIQVASARKNFAKVLARAANKGERIKVVRYRTTLAGIVPGRDLERLDECEDVMGATFKKKASPTAKSGRKKTARKVPRKKALARSSSRTTKKKRTAIKAPPRRK